jgi:hypothetical protein
MDKQLAVLSVGLVNAKHREVLAKNVRIDFEEKIASLLQGPPEGSVSDKDDHYKVTVTRKFNRTLDLDKYDQEKTTIPPDLDPVWLKPTLDLKKLRSIEEANPELYKKCCAFIESKPAKTSVTVKEVE